MKIALASGKGGTGKTTIAVALVRVASNRVSYLDCDVEEPNGFLFLRPEIDQRKGVTVPVPQVDKTLCIACGRCVDICQFNAIVLPKKTAVVFPEMCHGCGGCLKVCPVGAITEGKHLIGEVTVGHSGGIRAIEGRMNVGATTAPPVIRAVKDQLINSEIPRDESADDIQAVDELVIIDCPPGSACPMVAAVKISDYVILVTEPTPFGLHDLEIAVATMRELSLPFGVAINRFDAGDDRVEQYCRKEELDVLLRIPDLRLIARAGSRGEDLIAAVPSLKGDLIQALEFSASKHNQLRAITDQQELK